MLGLKCFAESARGSSDSTSTYVPSVCWVIRRKTLGHVKLVWHGWWWGGNQLHREACSLDAKLLTRCNGVAQLRSGLFSFPLILLFGTAYWMMYQCHGVLVSVNVGLLTEHLIVGLHYQLTSSCVQVVTFRMQAEPWISGYGDQISNAIRLYFTRKAKYRHLKYNLGQYFCWPWPLLAPFSLCHCLYYCYNWKARTQCHFLFSVMLFEDDLLTRHRLQRSWFSGRAWYLFFCVEDSKCITLYFWVQSSSA